MVAIIDMGTNTFNLVIASYNNLSFKINSIDKIVVKLGEGGISNAKISEVAQIRGLEALCLFRTTIDSQHIDQIEIYATSALRSASNSKYFLDKIYNDTGFVPDIIDGKREAEFIYEGVKAAIELNEKPDLIVDIGGGSVEFIIANRQEISWLDSFEIGAQRLKDHFHQIDPINKESINDLDKFLDNSLITFLSKQ